MTTPESLLAAMLSELDMHVMVDDPPQCDCGDWDHLDEPTITFNDHVRAAILATPEGARLLAAAEKGLAMRRALDIWPHSFKVYPDGPGWRVQYRLPSETEWTYTDIHDTLTAAIEAALEGEP